MKRKASLATEKIQRAADTLGLELQSVKVSNAEDFGSPFSAMVNERSQAVVVLAGPLMVENTIQIVKGSDGETVFRIFYQQGKKAGCIGKNHHDSKASSRYQSWRMEISTESDIYLPTTGSACRYSAERSGFPEKIN